MPNRGPYRAGCPTCIENDAKLSALRDELNVALGHGLHPHQGPDQLSHRCVFCDQRLYLMYARPREYGTHDAPKLISSGYRDPCFGSPGLDRNDMWVCSGPRTELRTWTTGSLWWRRSHQKRVTVNSSCPRGAHLHRHCCTCGAYWHERTKHVEVVRDAVHVATGNERGARAQEGVMQ